MKTLISSLIALTFSFVMISAATVDLDGKTATSVSAIA
jgi:hypothetical protein